MQQRANVSVSVKCERLVHNIFYTSSSCLCGLRVGSHEGTKTQGGYVGALCEGQVSWRQGEDALGYNYEYFP